MLLEALSAYPGLAIAVNVERFTFTAATYNLRARVILRDGSTLSIRDNLFEDGSRKYSYHWQDLEGRLLGRWDNAPHWPDIVSFPHHYHRPDGRVEPGRALLLADLVRIVAERLK